MEKNNMKHKRGEPLIMHKHRAQFAPANAETERNARGYGQNRNMGD
jgi:hypothetical protein